jgi:hypothetical protein
MVTQERLYDLDKAVKNGLVGILNLQSGKIDTYNFGEVQNVGSGNYIFNHTGDPLNDLLILNLKRPLFADMLKPINLYN